MGNLKLIEQSPVILLKETKPGESFRLTFHTSLQTTHKNDLIRLLDFNLQVPSSFVQICPVVNHVNYFKIIENLFIISKKSRTFITKHWWFSGRILACHAGGPGSIPGQCINFSFLSPLLNLRFKPRYV